MKIIPIKIAKSKVECFEEFKLSIMIHLALLLAMSAFFFVRQATATIEKPPVPIKLIASVAKPRTGSNTQAKKKIGAKKSQGTTKKVAPPRKKLVKKKAISKPVKKVVKTPAPVKAKVKAAKSKTKTAIATIPKKMPVIADIPIVAAKPTVVKKTVKTDAPVRPTHNSPAFETISHLSNEAGDTSEIDIDISDSMMVAPAEMLMPSLDGFGEKSVSTPADFMPATTGVEDSKPVDDNAGVFEIGSIESFGGNNEHFSAPSILRRVTPEYPHWAREIGIHGSAVYRVLIQSSGTVGDVMTMSSTIDPKLAIDGAQALRRWVFTPVLTNGKPRETWVKITVQYELN